VWGYNLEELEQAETAAQQLRAAVTALGGEGPTFTIPSTPAAFSEAMDNDLDTPAALQQLEQLAEEIIAAAQAGQNVAAAQATLRQLSQIFGLRLNAQDVEQRVIEGWGEHLERFT
jgi:cysteinyl-tRNA synthetase